MRVSVVTPPRPFVTIREAGSHVGLGEDVLQDEDLERIVNAACGHIDGPDGWLGRAVGEQVLLAAYDDFGCLGRLPFPELIDVDKVSYIDPDRATRVLDASLYDVIDSQIFLAETASWPTIYQGRHVGAFSRVQVQFRAGYAEVPAPIRAAVLLMVGDMYKFRETASDAAARPQVVPMSTTVDALLSPFRIYL